MATTVGERSETAAADSFQLIPRRTVHSQANRGTAPARALLVFSPPGLEGFLDEAAAETDAEKTMAIAAKYGMDIVGAPTAS